VNEGIFYPSPLIQQPSQIAAVLPPPPPSSVTLSEGAPGTDAVSFIGTYQLDNVAPNADVESFAGLMTTGADTGAGADAETNAGQTTVTETAPSAGVAAFSGAQQTDQTAPNAESTAYAGSETASDTGAGTDALGSPQGLYTTAEAAPPAETVSIAGAETTSQAAPGAETVALAGVATASSETGAGTDSTSVEATPLIVSEGAPGSDAIAAAGAATTSEAAPNADSESFAAVTAVLAEGGPGSDNNAFVVQSTVGTETAPGTDATSEAGTFAAAETGAGTDAIPTAIGQTTFSQLTTAPAPTVDGTSSSANAGQASLTFGHTIANASVLLVAVAHRSQSLSTGVTFNGVAMTLVGRTAQFFVTSNLDLYQLNNPDPGTHNIVVSFGGNQSGITAVGVGVKDAVDVQSLLTTASDSGLGSSLDIFAQSGDVVFDFLFALLAGFPAPQQSGQTVVRSQNGADSWQYLTSSKRSSAGAGFVTMSWDNPSAGNEYQIGADLVKGPDAMRDDFAAVGVTVVDAEGAPGVDATIGAGAAVTGGEGAPGVDARAAIGTIVFTESGAGADASSYTDTVTAFSPMLCLPFKVDIRNRVATMALIQNRIAMQSNIENKVATESQPTVGAGEAALKCMDEVL
jgi:hypothetical protein